MPELPFHRQTTTIRHEWVIGVQSHDTDAKDFAFGLHVIESEMKDLGVDLKYDDAYHVRAGEGGQIVFYVDRLEAQTEMKQ